MENCSKNGLLCANMTEKEKQKLLVIEKSLKLQDFPNIPPFNLRSKSEMLDELKKWEMELQKREKFKK